MNVSVLNLWCLPEYTARIIIIIIIIICRTTCLLSHKVLLRHVRSDAASQGIIMDLQCQSLCSPQTATQTPTKLNELN